MGKKGKVERKKKRQAYFTAVRKRARDERKQRLKSRKPLSQDLQNIRDGITEMIEEQGGEASPVAYYGCLLSLLNSRPDAKRLPYILALLDYYMGDVNLGVLQQSSGQLMDLITRLMKEYLADILIQKKGFQVIKSLFYHLPPTKPMMKKFSSLEPNKLHSEHMPLFLRAQSAALLFCHDKSPQLFHSLLLPFVKHNTNNLFETAEGVANAAARAYKTVIDNGMDASYVVNNADAVLQMLHHLVSCVQDIQFRSNWDHLADVMSHILRKVSAVKCVCDVQAIFGDTILQTVLPVVDKIRSLDDFHYNNAAERAVGSALRCVGASALLSTLRMNPLELDAVAGRHYLLNVLKKNVTHDNLAFFVEYFAPLVMQLRKAENEAMINKRHLESKTLSTIQFQVWDLLPGFARFPRDLLEGTTYRTVAKELVTMFNDVELSRIACHTFIVLIEKSRFLAEYVKEEEDASMKDGSEDGDSDHGDDESKDDGDEADAEMLGEDAKNDDDHSSLDIVEAAEAKQIDVLGAELDLQEGDDPHQFHMIPRDQAEGYLRLIGSYAKNIVPAICNAIEKERDEDRRVLILGALRSYASVADKSIVNSVFKNVSRNLIKATRVAENTEGPTALTPEQSSKARVMMEIGCVMVEYLDPEALNILIQIVEPLLIDSHEDCLLQKKSYRVLSRICRTRGDVVGTNIDRLVQILAQSQDHCDAASRRERIQCFLYIATMLNEHNETEQLKAFVAGTVAEVMLCLKESSSRTRDMSFQCLACFAELTSVNTFTQMIFAGLAGQTPELVSCTIITLGKILFEYHEVLDQRLKESMIKSGILFIRHKANEIKNAAMGFARVCLKVVTLSEDVKAIVESNMTELVNGCLSWTSQKRTPGNTRRTVQTIFERCIKRFGYGNMLQVFPKEHKQYIEYVETMRQREIKKALKERERRRNPKAATENKFAKMDSSKRKAKFDKIFFDEGKQRTAQEAMAAADDYDLLSGGIVKRFVSPADNKNAPSTLLDRLGRNEERGKDDGMNVGWKEGRLAVQTEADYKREKRQDLLQKKLAQMEGTERSGLEELSGGVLQQRKRRHVDDDEDMRELYDPDQLKARDELDALQRALKGPSKRERAAAPGFQSKRSRVEGDVRAGDHFRAKKGSYGDVKKGGVDPYAYVPLNAKYLNKRHRMKSISRVAAVGETARKGRKQGS